MGADALIRDFSKDPSQSVANGGLLTVALEGACSSALPWPTVPGHAAEVHHALRYVRIPALFNWPVYYDGTH